MKRETSGDDLLLANAIHILDKLQLLPGGEEEDQVGEQEGEDEDEGCRGGDRALLPISVVAAVFLLMQVITSLSPQFISNMMLIQFCGPRNLKALKKCQAM